MLNLGLRYLSIGFLFTFFFLGIANILYAQSNSIDWMSWEEMEQMMKKQKRKVLVDVYTDRCAWCKRMDATTFQNSSVIKIISRDYYAVKLNAEHKEDITFKDKIFKYTSYGNKGCHQLALEVTQGNLSFPTFVFMDENLDIIQPIPGYLDSETFEVISLYFSGNHHKSTPFQIFEESFRSSNKSGKNNSLKPVGNR
jgi:thioredoxin-related protein